MELTVHIPDALVTRLSERHGLSGTELEELTVDLLSKLANEPELPVRRSERAQALDRLTEKLSSAGVYDLPTAPVPHGGN